MSSTNQIMIQFPLKESRNRFHMNNLRIQQKSVQLCLPFGCGRSSSCCGWGTWCGGGYHVNETHLKLTNAKTAFSESGRSTRLFNFTLGTPLFVNKPLKSVSSPNFFLDYACQLWLRQTPNSRLSRRKMIDCLGPPHLTCTRLTVHSGLN